MIGVILAGGSGTRFWPRSRELYPKQFLRIAGPKTMLQNTVERILPLIPIERIFVVTNELHAFETCKQLAEYGFNPSNLLAEPVGKNTAAALGFAALMIPKADEVMAVFPADHVINDAPAFHQILQNAETVASKDYLVTLGIQPDRAETGYGYIKKGAPLDGLSGSYEVERFVEKPDAPAAQKFLDDGGYYWNCGVFLWKGSALLDEMKNLMPELYEGLASVTSFVRTNQGKYAFRALDPKGREIYQSLPATSIDYGVLEKSNNVAVVPVQMQWNDVGSWTALEDIEQKDPEGNVFSKNVISIDCSGSIIQGEGRLIAAVGIKDLIIVDTPDALLICDKARAQDVKKIVEKIKESRRPEARTHTRVHNPWGSYTVLERYEHHVIKRLEVLPGEKTSLKMHKHRDEHWFVVSGQAEVQKGEETFILNTGSTFIPRGTKHRLGNPGDTPLTIIEVQLGDHLDENDIIRYEDLYGRV